MIYDLVLCECACGRRQAYPVPPDADLPGFVCDTCLVHYTFDHGIGPSRIEMATVDDESYELGFRVFSARRSNAEMGTDIVKSWFPVGDEEAGLEEVA